MAGVLGIDAAWTEREPSGVALIEGSQEGWRCVAVTPSYGSFLDHDGGVSVDWAAKAIGEMPNAGRLVSAAEDLLCEQELAVVAVDMPLSTEPITGRRPADDAISSEFGGRWASTHSPDEDRPGAISTLLRDGFAACDFPLAVSTASVGAPKHLVEVYPHPALLTLTGASLRLPYKVAKRGRYWKRSSPAERKGNLLHQFGKILMALRANIGGIELELPEPGSAVTIAALKRYEDSLDALVCAWVGAKYYEGVATAYGDHTAAIWVP